MEKETEKKATAEEETTLWGESNKSNNKEETELKTPSELIPGENDNLDEKTFQGNDLNNKEHFEEDFTGLPSGLEGSSKPANDNPSGTLSIEEAIAAGEKAAEDKNKIFDAKGEEIDPSTLQELPPSDGYAAFVSAMTKSGHNAEVIDGQWTGKPESVCFIGYPNTWREDVTDKDGNVLEIKTGVMTIDVPLIELYFDEATHCFACVRADVYRRKV